MGGGSRDAPLRLDRRRRPGGISGGCAGARRAASALRKGTDRTVTG